jgi:cytochrome c biogenesis protein CcmG, thiol:disulfide interchange protein DsbE
MNTMRDAPSPAGAQDAPVAPVEPRPPRPSLVRRHLFGPFSVGHLLALAGALVATIVVFTIVFTPVAQPVSAGVAQPGTAFVPFGTPVAGLRVGDVAPELSGQADGATVQLRNLDGNVVSLAAHRGRAIWLTFFASWCPPCQAETPTIERMAEAHRADGLDVIAVSVQETSPADVQAYARTYGLTYTIGFDATSAVYRAFAVYGLPTQFFLDRNGVIRKIVNGPMSDASAEAAIAEVVAR